jgi:L-lactate utilization protein LutC
MAMTLPKALERKLETFKRVKGSDWKEELEELLDDAVDSSVKTILTKASKLSSKEAEAILDKRRKPVMSDRQAGRVAREAVTKVRQKFLGN